MFELNVENVTDYLKRREVIAPDTPVEATALGWGISNIVLKVLLPDECMVIKQSLPKLRVQDEWLFDQSRIVIEHRCMAAMDSLLPGSVPTLRFADDEHFIFGMSCVPEDGVLWKEALMQGQVDDQAAAYTGTLLAQWHVRCKARPDILAQFTDNTNFIQGRMDPYYRRAAEVHPDLAPVIEQEIERMLALRQTLVHGDFSPKNIFIYVDRAMTIDLEVAHHGDPAFDTAFCLNHLLLKACHFAPHHPAYLQAARTFWQTYDSQAGEAHFPAVEAHTVRALACLLLARIDGKSRVEYITDEAARDRVRQFAITLLRSDETRVEAIIAQLADYLDSTQE